MADAIDDAMIEAGVKALRERVTLRFPHMDAPTVEEIYLAMEAARQPQLPSDDGLIKALQFIGGHDAAANGLSGFAFELVELLTGTAREALSRHKAPLSVRDQVERDKEAFASLSPGEQQAAREELRSIGQNPGVEFAPLSVAGDDVPVRSPEGAVKIDGASVQPGLEVTTPRARTISQKPHQPSLTALQVTEGDKR